MRHYLIASVILVAVCISLLIPQANALPVSFNTTSINLGMTSIPRNSSSYDVFVQMPDNMLYMKFNNNTLDSSQFLNNGIITYHTSLKALYKFENTLTDSTTNARTLTMGHGAVVYTTSGAEGFATSWNGSNYATGSDTGLASVNGAWTVSEWIYPTSASSTIFSWGTNAANQGINIYLTGQKIRIDNVSTVILTGATTVSLNTWTYISVTYDGTTMKIYENGIQDANTATPAAFNITLTGATGEHVGTYTNLTQDFSGIMDELRYYTIALSSAQVNGDYMVGKYAQSHTFDTGEYMTASDQSMPLSNNVWTITGWIKPTINTGNFIFGWGTNVNNQGINIGLSGGFLRVDNVGSNLITGTTTIPNNSYTYFAITYDGSTIKDYVNGNPDQSASLTGLNIVSSGATGTKIGVNINLSGQFTGQIDNLKVYPYPLSATQITSDFGSISPISSGKQFMSWYNGISGSNVLTQKLGSTKATLTLGCNLNTKSPVLVSNVTNIYYDCENSTTTSTVFQVPITSGTSTKYFATADLTASINNRTLFSTMQNIMVLDSTNVATNAVLSTKSANSTQAGTAQLLWTVTDQKIHSKTTTAGLKYNQNVTSLQVVSTNDCEINYKPTNNTKVIDKIACDQSIPAMAIKYWQGFMIQKVANYNTNSTQTFLSSIDASAYKKLLSLPCNLMVHETPCVDFILTDFTNTDYLVVLTSTHVYYVNAQTALNYLLHNNYGFQSYDIITQLTSSAFEIQNPILQPMKLYGPLNFNITTSKAGLFTLPSGYTAKTTSNEPSIRTIDPRWTDDTTDIPIITSSPTQSLFQIFLTISNAPQFSAVKVTNPYQILNSQEAVWAVAQLDSTRTVEFDIPDGTCVNVYTADISVSPSIWNFEGIICATGINQKTIAFTNTLPTTFFTLQYGVSHTYVPSNNGLQTQFHTQQSPTTYTVIVRNSTGTIAINSTFTVPANQTLQLENFNVSSVSKPASLSVSVLGNQIYSAYLGSPLSLATTAAFFHQYFSYQGFDFLSFIPLIFASMFTRNTVGIGAALVVVCIATLSWLSIVVVPDTVIFIGIVVAAVGMIGYRGYQAYG